MRLKCMISMRRLVPYLLPIVYTCVGFMIGINFRTMSNTRLFISSSFMNQSSNAGQISRPTTSQPHRDVYNKTYMTALLNRVKPEQDDPRLIELIRNHFLEPPSTLPYQLRYPTKHDYSEFGQTRVIEKHLKNMVGGFFVECGGYDGETSSNSLHFEKDRNWGGVLIEADPTYYTMLKKKNRKAFSLNACLSVTPYPAEMTFYHQKDQRGRVIHNEEAKNWVSKQRLQKHNAIKVQCFPLYSILLALNRTTVDFLSLDVEGDELYVLKTIPFDKVDIRMMTVEFNNQKTHVTTMIQFLKENGYTYLQKLGVDIIFRKT